jgi:hypothetical protein
MSVPARAGRPAIGVRLGADPFTSWKQWSRKGLVPGNLLQCRGMPPDDAQSSDGERGGQRASTRGRKSGRRQARAVEGERVLGRFLLLRPPGERSAKLRPPSGRFLWRIHHRGQTSAASHLPWWMALGPLVFVFGHTGELPPKHQMLFFLAWRQTLNQTKNRSLKEWKNTKKRRSDGRRNH